MISEEKISKARKSLDRGEPKGELRESLSREGHSKENIDRVFEPERYDVFSGLLFFQYYRKTERLRRK